MAGLVEILLKLKGDSKQAVDEFNKTTGAAKRTEEQVDRTNKSIQNMLKSISVSSAISAFGSLQSAIGQVIDFLDPGQAQREAGLERQLGLADSPASMGAQAAKLARERALRGGTQARVSKFLQDVWPGTPAGQTKVGRRVNELRGILDAYSLAEATVALANVPESFFENAPEGYTRSDLTRELAQRGRATAFRAGLQGDATTTNRGNVTINNEYPVGTNPRSVDVNMSRYERVNGRPRRQP